MHLRSVKAQLTNRVGLLDRRGRPPRRLAALAPDARLRRARGRARPIGSSTPPSAGSPARTSSCSRTSATWCRSMTRHTTRSPRMRRVDEAIKAVVSETIPTLKDPRIGFVTVTGVVTTSDLAQATVWLSVYGGEKRRLGTLAALEGAAGILQARVNSQLHLRRTPQLLFEYDQSVEHGVRMTKLIDDLDPGPEIPKSPKRRAMSQTTTDMAAVVDALAPATGSSSPRTRTPTATRSGRCSRCTSRSSSSARTASWCSSGAAPLPAEYAFLDLGGARASARGARRRRRADPRRGRLCAGDAAHRRSPARGDGRRQHRPPPRQHALRDGQPGRRRGVVDGRGARGRLRRARGRADAGDRRGALRRARHRHRPLPVLEHDAEGAAPGGRAASRPAPTCSGSSRASTSRCRSRR